MPNMKYILPLLVPLLAHQTVAFPSAISEGLGRQFDGAQKEWLQERAAAAGCPAAHLEEREAASDCPFAKRQAPGIIPPFDAALQYVSNTGAHAFVAPGSGDQRGPCPGLNALANHGYLPHNGVGTIEDFIVGTTTGFGMGADLATFLAIYGAIFDGNLLEYSIGGPVSGLANGDGLLGTPEGLSGSHNKYEGDSSPTRGDLYEYGNDYLLQLSQFEALYELGQENGDSIDLDILTNYRVTRFQQSIDDNPYFFNAPFSGVVALPAAWSFVYRFMANKSEEYPTGLLTGDVLKSFYSVTGDYGSFVYTAGHEKIPDNWYKRNPIDYYTIPYYAIDANTMNLAHPQFLSIGGNVGKVNTFVGVDPANLTGGVYNADMLLEGNNAICYGLELSLMEAPDILSGLYSDTDAAMDALGTAIDAATDGLGCPTLNTINKDQFDIYPGYTQLQTDGEY